MIHALAEIHSERETSWGIIEGDRVIAVAAIPSVNGSARRATHALAEVKIELPLVPRTFYCVG